MVPVVGVVIPEECETVIKIPFWIVFRTVGNETLCVHYNRNGKLISTSSPMWSSSELIKSEIINISAKSTAETGLKSEQEIAGKIDEDVNIKI